ncbi:MAG: hypothetical protein F6K54_24275 [Okeania sp. SIO3B5]|uniref:hypothetical protein n=1 Tax=Okeania sp. SIO3B5 TaxID=2607811 RepID=UPI0014012128|nr:hypothetical protein [Okeania sp. SIO3B5]NEO55907.1 hypothetical protein [Okeania sp. SIO3B5]
MVNQETWERQILNSLKHIRKTTIAGNLGSSQDINDRTTWELYEYTSNKDLDQKQRYYLAGPEWSIILQSSLLKAGHDMLGDRLGFTINFEKWFEDFEYEFQKNLPSTKKPAASKFKPWGREVANRPKKLNLLTKEQARLKGYMVIRFWKDREIENDSKILTGTYTELRKQLLEEIKEPLSPGNNFLHIPPDKIMRRTQPRVFMYFLEDMADVEPGYSPVAGEIGFRIMDKSDSRESPLPKITKADLSELATKIKSSFWNNGGYVWKKGKNMYPYTMWAQGYQLQLLCRNKIVAKEIVNKVLAIQGHAYNSKYFTNNLPEEPEKNYPIIPKKINVLGEEVKEPRYRPIADVKFQYATIFLQNWPQIITLVSDKGEILPNLVNSQKLAQEG